MRTAERPANATQAAPGGRGAGGAVVAAHRLAAEAGAEMLRAGGNAADAAVATAAALAVVDCANCGLGGFGGFAVVEDATGEAMQVAFNARVPRGFRAGHAADGAAGLRVSPPAVVAGLAALQARLGRARAADVWAPAIRLAREGFAVGKDLERALRWAAKSHGGLNAAFRDAFLPGGEPLREGARLAQPRLAATLERVAAEGAQALRSGAIVDSLCATVAQAGGCLEPADFASLEARVTAAATCAWRGATLHAAAPDECGAGIVFAALRSLDGVELGEARAARYVEALGAALGAAWREREAAYPPLARAASSTSHLAAADRDGLLVSMTFTHGPSWFGSGLLDAASGLLLNTGASIFVRRASDGAIVALPNLAPVVLRRGDARYAIGSPGGRHIPAIVLQAVVDLAHYGADPGDVLGKPRLSGNARGHIDAEAELRAAAPALVRREIAREEYYGPAGLIAWGGGEARAHGDPRFEGACVEVAQP